MGGWIGGCVGGWIGGCVGEWVYLGGWMVGWVCYC